MPLKEDVRAKICIDISAPHYPLANFVGWVESSLASPTREGNRKILRYLTEIQNELNSDAQEWREAEADSPVQQKEILEHRARSTRWCFYCAQVRAYYEGICGPITPTLSVVAFQPRVAN